MQDGAFSCALILDRNNRVAADDGALQRYRVVNFKTLLAVKDLQPIDAERGIPHPHAGMRENATHRRNDPKIILVDECQLVGIGRFRAKTQPECVKDRVPAGVSVRDGFETKIANGFEIQGASPSDISGQFDM
jgi:hypothetical protein